MASLLQNDVENVLEIYMNETQDYDEIADRCNITVLDVANIINEEIRVNNFIESIGE